MSDLIYKQMCAIQRDIRYVEKGDHNTYHNFDFRSIDRIYNYLHDIFVKHSVFCVPEVLENQSEEHATTKGKTNLFRILKIRYTFYAEDGSCVQATVMGEAMDTSDKASNKAMAAAHKYCLLQTFLIPTEEQNDPDFDPPNVDVPTTIANPITKNEKDYQAAKKGLESVLDVTPQGETPQGETPQDKTRETREIATIGKKRGQELWNAAQAFKWLADQVNYLMRNNGVESGRLSDMPESIFDDIQNYLLNEENQKMIAEMMKGESK